MASVKDVCRICVKDVDYYESQEIDLKKIGIFLEKSFLPQWDISDFQNHIICDTCICNFQTIWHLHKMAWKANGLVLKLKSKLRKLKCSNLDLRKLDNFNVQNDFPICRLCLKPTKSVGVYLSNSDHNILPFKYVTNMLRYLQLHMVLLEKTLNPVLCWHCWQRIQVSFSFRKHLDTVTAKCEHYERLLQKRGLNREELEDVLHMWNHLGVAVTNSCLDDDGDVDLCVESPKTENREISHDMPKLSAEHTFYEEHNYFIRKPCIRSRETSETLTAEDVELEMPKVDTVGGIAKDIVHDSNIVLNVMSKNSMRKKRKKRKKLPRAVKSKMQKQKEKEAKAKNKKLVDVVKSKTKKEQTLILPNVLHNFQNGTRFDLRPRTRLSDKKRKMEETYVKDPLVLKKEEIIKKKRAKNSKRSAPPKLIENSDLKDLLVLQKEEIIKKKRVRNSKFSAPGNVSTPKKHENTVKIDASQKECQKSPFKLPSNEFTFERLNFDNEVQDDRGTSQEDVIVVKKEVVTDSDDDFVEYGAFDTNETRDVELELCPNLDVFIKAEPTEIIDPNGDGDDEDSEPPELEFQGPCIYDPKFTISETFSVNDRPNFINSVDDKRDLMHLLEDNSQSTFSGQNKNELVAKNISIQTKSVGEKIRTLFDQQNDQVLNENEEKLQQASFSSVKKDISMPTLKPAIKDFVVRLTENDTKAVLDFKAKNNNENWRCNGKTKRQKSSKDRISSPSTKRAGATVQTRKSVKTESNNIHGGDGTRKIKLGSSSKTQSYVNTKKKSSSNSKKTGPDTPNQRSPKTSAKLNPARVSVTQPKGQNVSDKSDCVKTKTNEIKVVNNHAKIEKNPNVVPSITEQHRHSSKVDVDQIKGKCHKLPSPNSHSVQVHNRISPIKEKPNHSPCTVTSKVSRIKKVQKVNLNRNRNDNVDLTEKTLHKNVVNVLSPACSDIKARNQKTDERNRGRIDKDTCWYYHNEIRRLTIDSNNPYQCRMCPFITTFSQGAKCHVSQHINSVLEMESKEHEMGSKVESLGLSISLPPEPELPAHSCAYCDLRYAGVKCLQCRRYFHPKCLLLDQIMTKFDCGHYHVDQCINVFVNGSILVTKQELPRWAAECDYCNKPLLIWISCNKCNRYLHYHCFILSKAYSKQRCLHNDSDAPLEAKRALVINIRRNNLRELHQRQKGGRRCDFCKVTTSSVFQCLQCLQFMHHKCFVFDARLSMTPYCKHANIVEGVNCEFCTFPPDYTSVMCTKCDKILHKNCLSSDKTQGRDNCDHNVKPYFTKQSFSLTENGECFKDTQTPLMPLPQTSTSREVKQELMESDLSDFIMLCD